MKNRTLKIKHRTVRRIEQRRGYCTEISVIILAIIILPHGRFKMNLIG